MNDLLTSQKIQLKLQTSLANPHVPRRTSSVAIQIKLPIWVAVFAVGPFTSLPNPKSAILTLLSVVMSKFGVFKSRCATPCSCNQERPAVTASIASLPCNQSEYIKAEELWSIVTLLPGLTSPAIIALRHLSNACNLILDCIGWLPFFSPMLAIFGLAIFNLIHRENAWANCEHSLMCQERWWHGHSSHWYPGQWCFLHTVNIDFKLAELAVNTVKTKTNTQSLINRQL